MRFEPSRRMTFWAAAGFLAPAFFWVRRTAAQPASSPQTVGYQDTPKGLQMCGTCTLFISPNGCKVVEGPVDRRGWCKLYDPVD